MTTLLLLLTLLLTQQGNRPESGTIRGRLTTTNGGPASMVRIALVPPDTTDPITELLHISQTDSAGLYELANVPPGRYKILAGQVNRPTYYPGVPTADEARIVTIAAGEILSDLGFRVSSGLTPAPGTAISGGNGTVTGRVRLDDSSLLPMTSTGFLRLVESTGRILGEVYGPLGTFALQLAQRDTRFTVSRLPVGYYLKSMTYGNVDLTAAPLTLPASSNTTEVEIVLTKTRPEHIPRGVRVTGHVTRGEGALLQNRPLELLNISGGRLTYAATVVLAENDMFSIEDVPPGRYRFGPVNGALEFDAGANDVTGLIIHLGKPDTVVPLNSNSRRTVQAIIEGLGDTIPRFEIAFISTRTPAAHIVTVRGKEFSVDIPEGEYRISISGLPDGYTVESVNAGPLDLTSPFLLTHTGIADRFSGKGTAVGIKVRLRRS